MLNSKAIRCPRCGGWLQPQGDLYGSYATCINCGHVAEVKPQGTPSPVGYRGPRHSGRAL